MLSIPPIYPKFLFDDPMILHDSTSPQPQPLVPLPPFPPSHGALIPSVASPFSPSLPIALLHILPLYTLLI